MVIRASLPVFPVEAVLVPNGRSVLCCVLDDIFV